MNKTKPKLGLDRYTYFLFTLIPLAAYSFFFVYSMLVGIGYSFTDWNGLDRTYNLVGFRNYINLLQNSRFWNAMRVTLIYAAVLLAGVILVSLVLALCLNSVRRFQTLLKSIFFFPAMVSLVAIALIWDQLYYRALPQVGQALGIAALSQSPLGSQTLALPAVLFVNIWQAVAMPTLIFLAGLQSIPEDLYESAMIDGATPFQRFRFITLPFLGPTITINVVLTLKAGLTVFDFPFVLTTGGPARATEVIGILIYNDAFEGMRFYMANTEAVVLFLIIAALSFIQIKLTNKE